MSVEQRPGSSSCHRCGHHRCYARCLPSSARLDEVRSARLLLFKGRWLGLERWTELSLRAVTSERINEVTKAPLTSPAVDAAAAAAAETHPPYSRWVGGASASSSSTVCRTVQAPPILTCCSYIYRPWCRCCCFSLKRMGSHRKNEKR